MTGPFPFYPVLVLLATSQLGGVGELVVGLGLEEEASETRVSAVVALSAQGLQQSWPVWVHVSHCARLDRC